MRDVALATGAEVGPDRQAVIARILAGEDFQAHEMTDIVRHLATDEYLDSKLRYGGKLAPYDFTRARDEVRKVDARRQAAAERSAADRAADERVKAWLQGKSHTQPVEAPRLRGKKENLRRLRANTGNLPHDHPNYHNDWNAYYARDYTDDARERARRQLDAFDANDSL